MALDIIVTELNPAAPLLIEGFGHPKSVMGISTVFGYCESMKKPCSLLGAVDVMSRNEVKIGGFIRIVLS
jgi:hypothetical protein